MILRSLSLRTKVFFLFAGAVLLTVGPALILVARAVEERVYERATEELARAGEALAINWALEDEVLLGDARLRALEPAVLEPLLEGDTVRLRRLLAHRLADGRVVVAADSSGRPLVGPAPDSATLWAAVGLGSIITERGIAETPLRIAVWPVMNEGQAVGVVGVGTPLDARVARRLDEVLGTNVALVVDGLVTATTLPDTVGSDLQLAELATLVERGGTWRRLIGSRWYLYRVQSLPVLGQPAAVLLFRPVGDELRIASGIRQSIGGIGVVAVVLALLLAGLVARIVARPAQVLAQAASHLARGDYGAPLPTAAGDEIGQLTRVFGEMRSAIAEREARLRSAQAEMIHREKLAAMGRLVAQLSHEINNPIYNIQNCLEALARRGDPEDPNREFLDVARDELSRMAILTGQLLDQSRPLSDAARPLDLNAVVRRVVSLAEPALEAHAIETELVLDPALPNVVAHPDAIQQVLANLVDNAVDAMVGGGRLRITTRADSAAVEVAVEDSGHGIPEDHLPHIFEAFYTTKPGVRGVGLGLFVSEGIVRGHRGRLSVESHPGRGSCFLIQLPLEVLDESVSEAERTSGPAESGPAAVKAEARSAPTAAGKASRSEPAPLAPTAPTER